MSSKFLEKRTIVKDFKFLLIACLIEIIIIILYVNNFWFIDNSLYILIRIILPLLMGIAIGILYGALSNSDIKQKLIFGFLFLFMLFIIDNFIGFYYTSLNLDTIFRIFYYALDYTIPSFIFLLIGHLIRKFIIKNHCINYKDE